MFSVASPFIKRAGLVGLALLTTAAVTRAAKAQKIDRQARKDELKVTVPSRASNLKSLKSGREFDVLIIGGGATGTGIALDATLRGLDVALVERDDFASATSSRSTKLIHGGVRYLEKAVKHFDRGQLMLVFDALQERATFLKNAPHLTRKLPIMTPCYSWWEIPYYWAGMKMYDLLSLRSAIGSSRYASPKESLIQFPVIQPDGLCGSIVYFDGQMDDSRMNVSLALTAAVQGASIANHLEVVSLLHKEVPYIPTGPFSQPKLPIHSVVLPRSKRAICGATVRDVITGETWDIHAKTVINATGAFVDHFRTLDQGPQTKNMINPSSGTHVVLPDYFAPIEMGMVIPKTKDGRVVFLVPWQGKVVAGTTDAPTKLTYEPKPTEDEINFILDTIQDYVAVKVRREDVLAAWTGIRPLATNPNSTNTEDILRDHIIEVSPTGMMTISGGKWTTYRRMADDAVNTLLATNDLSSEKKIGPCTTDEVPMIGAKGWDKGLFLNLVQDYYRVKTTSGTSPKAPMTSDIAKHLSHSYGTRSFLVADIATKGFGKRLAHGHPYIEAEIVYAVQNEYALTAVDVLARRLRLAFLDAKGAQQALPRTLSIMSDLLGWDEARVEKERIAALQFLEQMD